MYLMTQEIACWWAATRTFFHQNIHLTRRGSFIFHFRACLICKKKHKNGIVCHKRAALLHDFCVMYFFHLIQKRLALLSNITRQTWRSFYHLHVCAWCSSLKHAGAHRRPSLSDNSKFPEYSAERHALF